MDGGAGPSPFASPEAARQMTDPVQRRLLALLEGQTEVLGLISARAGDAGITFDDVLSRIADLAESSIDSALCAIEVLDPENQELVRVIGPGLPAAYMDAVMEEHGRGGDAGRALRDEWGTPVRAPTLAEGGKDASNRRLALAWSHGFQAYCSLPVRGRGGSPIGALALHFREPHACDPVTERIIADLARLVGFAAEQIYWAKAMRSADLRFAALAQNIPGVVYQRTVKSDGQIRYTYISDGAKDLFGVPPEEILTDPNALFDCHGAQYRETFRDRLLTASRNLSMWDVEATIVTRSGQRKFTHAIARPHLESDGTVVWNGVILDATRIKEAELEAAATEARTREAILENMSQGLVLYDKDDRLVVCNSHFRHLYPELDDVTEPGTPYEAFARAMVERGLDVAGDETDTDPAARFDELMDLHRGGDFVLERPLRNGRWVLINEHRTSDGGAVIVNTDVTDLKEREAALQRSNEELQNFASVASHDLQEPLRKIEAFGDRLQRKCSSELSEEAALSLDRIRSSARRMRDLIEDLLTYSRVTSKAQPFEMCDLRSVVNEVISDLHVQIKETGGDVQVDDLPVLQADATQMRQLLQNLIGNALKFHRKDTAPMVAVSARVVSGSPQGRTASPRLGEMCELTVSDNGIGFEMKYADRIFGIFQRLHGRSEYEGTGIGLATCRKIAERHGGKISVASEPGKGTTFTVTLPMAQAVLEAA